MLGNGRVLAVAGYPHMRRDPLVFEENLDGPRGQPHIDLGADMGADFGDDFESFAWPTMRERSALYWASASLLRVAEAIKTDGVRFD